MHAGRSDSSYEGSTSSGAEGETEGTPAGGAGAVTVSEGFGASLVEVEGSGLGLPAPLCAGRPVSEGRDSVEEDVKISDREVGVNAASEEVVLGVLSTGFSAGFEEVVFVVEGAASTVEELGGGVELVVSLGVVLLELDVEVVVGSTLVEVVAGFGSGLGSGLGSSPPPLPLLATGLPLVSQICLSKISHVTP